jgi:hypothetical protein
MSDGKAEDGGVTRLSFIKTSAGVAAGLGAAAIGVPGVASAKPTEERGVPTDPSTPTPPEPIVAYVRDAESGEVTVVSGTSEATYRDRALVERMLDAAPNDATSGKEGA